MEAKMYPKSKLPIIKMYDYWTCRRCYTSFCINKEKDSDFKFCLQDNQFKPLNSDKIAFKQALIQT